MAGQSSGAPGPSTTRKRSKSTKAAAEPIIAETMTDDPVNQSLEEAYLGSFAIDVRELTLEWKKSRNRAVDHSLIEKLKTSFKLGVRRFAIEDRLRVMVQSSEFESILAHMAKISSNDPNLDLQSPDGQCQLKELRSQVLKRTTLQNQLLFVPSLPDSVAPPVVCNGQHRVVALRSLLDEQRELAAKSAVDTDGNIITAPTKEQYYWSVDIYAEDLIPDDTMAALMANRQAVQKANSEGFNAVQFISRLEALSPAEREKTLVSSTVVKRWINNVFGIDLQHASRILTILRHEEFRRIVKKYCLTRYGEHNYSWNLMESIIQSKLDFIWFDKISEFFTFGDTIFGDHVYSISLADWRRTLELDNDRPDAQLRLLFFPKREDYWDGKQKKKVQWGLPSRYQSSEELPKLTSPYTVDQHTFSNRRPGFLLALNDQQYIGVFERLRQNCNLGCPTWTDWKKMNDQISNTVKFLLRHIMVWVDPAWVYPNAASNDLKAFMWDKVVENILLKDSTLQDGANRPFPPNANLEAIAKDFILSIWSEVEEEILWQDSAVKKQVVFIPGELQSGSPDSPECHQYLELFKAPHWARLVKLVIKTAGPCLDGAMEKFNNLAELGKIWMPYSPWGDVTSLCNFTQNRLLQKVPSLNTAMNQSSLSLESTIMGSLWHYRELKKLMLDTLLWGWKAGIIKKSRKAPKVIESLDEYETAVNVLQECAYILQYFGYDTDIDNSLEDLDALTLDRRETAPKASPHPRRKLGFLTRRPEALVTNEDKVYAGVRELAQTIQKNTLEKPSSKKRRRSQVDDQDEPGEESAESMVRRLSITLDHLNNTARRAYTRKLKKLWEDGEIALANNDNEQAWAMINEIKALNKEHGCSNDFLLEMEGQLETNVNGGEEHTENDENDGTHRDGDADGGQ